ncbi:MAG: restriction endonuclease subunit S [Gammaproteobacteria bacterium]|nr:restriction endonuclease subunit S [Gammaproteobacteria bacterium]MBU1477973.1 restriction endonuclease subunit S [Gammaproteobacteria bacterium]MBU2000871.1 restriction endonuclease subunit S [Gammaproteobacteria bacterium]MBU2132960.1 restriction endonuclease subunit S [Gammaproteobacteria bacterium]MBU2186686.1 restriction endonuclease subunit S [Gammaproteobacteria bacterium]
MTWKTSKLGEVCEIIKRGIGPKYLEVGGVCVVNQKCIRDHIINYQLARRHDNEAKKVSEERYIKIGDVLVNSTGTGTLGRVAQVRAAPLELTTVDTHVTIVRPKEGVFYDDFFGYMLIKIEEAMTAAGEGASGQTELARSTLENEFFVSYPESISEQKHIVTILDQAFADIEQARAKTEQNLKNARELLESYLQQVFTAGINEGKVSRLEDLCTFSSGSTPSKKNDLYWGGNIPWMSGRDMKSTQLFNSFLHISQLAIDESTTRIAPKGTILILVRGMGLAHGAQVSELMVPSAFNQDIKGITPNSNIVSRYLVFALRHRINFGDNILSSAAHGTLKINMDELKNVVIPVPLKAQQEHLVSQFDILIEKINCLESIYQRKLANLNELKKSILQKAFTGKLNKSST